MFFNLQPANVTTALRKNNYPGVFGGKYQTSPYRGCGHNCAYCDGRYEKYQVEGVFHKDIQFRPNLPQQIATELNKRREFGPICFISGTSDPYQPCEANQKLITECAKEVLAAEYPASVVTKSKLVERDFDLWQQVHKKTGFVLMMTVSYPYDEVRRFMEPYASSVQARLNCLHRFAKAGMGTGAMVMPILPFIADDDHSLNMLAGQLAETGVDFVMPGGLTLKSGRQKDFFMNVLQENRPDLLPRFQDLYTGASGYGAPVTDYCNHMYQRATKAFIKHNIPLSAPHKLYRGTMQLYDEITILLHDLYYIYSWRKFDVTRLKQARVNWSNWVNQRKTYYARRRNLPYCQLDTEIKNLAADGYLKQVLDNAKLADFLNQVILKGQVLNYLTLKFE